MGSCDGVGNKKKRRKFGRKIYKFSSWKGAQRPGMPLFFLPEVEYNKIWILAGKSAQGSFE